MQNFCSKVARLFPVFLTVYLIQSLCFSTVYAAILTVDTNRAQKSFIAESDSFPHFFNFLNSRSPSLSYKHFDLTSRIFVNPIISSKSLLPARKKEQKNPQIVLFVYKI